MMDEPIGESGSELLGLLHSDPTEITAERTMAPHCAKDRS